ncbi:MAG: RNA polymerase sigma factor [Flavobacterium sp.]|nr:RNA polymerase sigma factor [Flavobacterium sp.]
MQEEDFIKELLNAQTKEAAFKKLVHEYQRPLYNLIRSIVLNHDDSDDILQNTFIKIFQNIDKFKGESKLFSWMYRIATNEALTFMKSKAFKNKISNEELQTKLIDNLAADIYFDGDEIQLKLQKAMFLLPEKQQLVFKMKYFQELKYEEMSTILGTSVGALKASYHFAVKKIEDYLNSN